MIEMRSTKSRIKCAWGGHRRQILGVFDHGRHREVTRQCDCKRVTEARVYEKAPVPPAQRPTMRVVAS